ncbi:MAG TPA: DUF429 domain-containing protein [Ramlibacter sp.]|uniref:DUF429 domain-containing protein n=1 Tax=Ramlibacter sp. TaxID=1917967 RepID=UPI002CC2B4FE|nr:DUF429 domain-containing protein [Ramlibacter sp.]HVZ42454.1 DUF429 domain-containing protein [Ramlibacter sp.]
MTQLPILLGCDFSSTPTRRKPIVLALGTLQRDRVVLSRLEALPTLAEFAHRLSGTPDWIGGFDFPFGLPRELVEHLGWPNAWRECIAHYARLTRAEIRGAFSAFCDARPAGAKFAHRKFDRLAGSSPSMKWVNPPVAYMLHAAVPLLIEAGVHLPGLHEGDPRRVALEAYPGLLARELIGRRSYKSDEKAKQTPERLIARKDIVTALEQGRTRLGLRLKLTHAQHDALIADASGDRLDAVLCLVQAAWAARHGPPRYGLPHDLDPLEGWIVSA